MRFRKWIVGAAIAAGISVTAAGSAQPDRPLYKDSAQPVEKRVEDLLSRMTLEEKVAQLETIWEQKAKVQTPDGHFDPALASANFPNGIGGFARPSDRRGVVASNGAAGAAGEGANRGARETADYVNAAQHWAIEHTRLGIPLLMHEESLHGYVARDATSFPQAIALASTWDPELVSRIFSVAAREARARGSIRPSHAAIVGRPREAADAVREILRRELGRELPGGRLYLGFLLPDRFELRDFLVEGHAREQVVHAFRDRLVWVFVDRHLRLSGMRIGPDQPGRNRHDNDPLREAHAPAPLIMVALT